MAAGAFFFSNSTGILAPEAEKGFRAIGMLQTADVIAAQIAYFGPDYPRDQDDRESILDLRDQQLEALLEAGNDKGVEQLSVTYPPSDEETWELLDTERGGFDAAANKYAAEMSPDLA